MRLAKLASIVLLTTLQAVAGDAPSHWLSASLPDVEFRVRLIRDVDHIEQMLGDDLDKSFILAEMEVRPLYDTKVTINRDDFVLRSRADNESSEAQSPDRIAGDSVLSLGQKTRGGGVFGQSGDPTFSGGLPGMPGSRVGSPGIGSSTIGSSETTVTAQKAETGTLLERLQMIEIDVEPSTEQRSGYLFFQLDPGAKLKHLLLTYDGEYGRFKLEYRDK